LNPTEKNTLEVQQFVQDHLEEDPAQLLFRYAHKVSFDLKFAVHQIQSRQKLKQKLSSWVKSPEVVFPVSLSLEQASSEVTAAFKSNQVSGKLMIDLTGGMGVDTFFLSQNFEHAVYCERTPELFETTQHNLQILCPDKITYVSGNSLDYLQQTSEFFDLIYLDPARRDINLKKVFQLSDCEPNVVSHWDVLTSKSNAVMIKVSPMLDLKMAIKELPGIQKIWVISHKNEVKEIVLFWRRENISKEVHIEVVELSTPQNQNFEFTFEEEEQANSDIGAVQNYLIEPLASILKAGAFKLFGDRYGLKKIHVNTHLYTSDVVPKNIPGRIFQIEKEILQPKKEIKSLFPSGKVNVLTRNYSLKAEALKKKYQLKDGGDDYLIGANSNGEYKLWKCKRLY
jgi:16S rRNA G966 N2-methylase RsmD